MKTNSLLRIFLFVMIAGLLSLSCSPTGTSSVTIHINLGLDNKAAFNAPEGSIIDRILRFFAKDAKAQTAPLGITSIGLSVTGEGMSAINNTYPADTSTITLDVPAGTARVFQVTAYRPTGNWGGSSEQYDLEAGQSVEIPITMAAQYASVTINPAYPNGTPASSTLTYTVNVTTSGQVVLSSATFTPGTPINVPAGASKEFEVLVNTPSVTFRGTVSTNLTADSSVIITPSMMLYETKIVIPDSIGSFGTPRVVQIDDITGTGWLECQSIATSPPIDTYFRPNDIDFDSQGRIYIANNNASTDADVIARIDTINGENPFTFGSNGSGYAAIAIDRTNDIVYCARSGVNTLWRYNINGSLISQVILTGITFSAIRGLAIDDSSNLYIAATNSTGLPRVIKCTPGNPSTNVIEYSANLNTPWDVVVKENFLYVTNFAGSDGYLIQQLDLNLNQLGHIGNQSTSADSVPGNFYGPKRFLAILNRGLYIIDEASEMEGPTFAADRLVYFNDISLSGWQPSSGLSIDFWWQC